MIINIIKDFFKFLGYFIFFLVNVGLFFSAMFCFPGLNDKETAIAFILTILFVILEIAVIKNSKYKELFK